MSYQEIIESINPELEKAVNYVQQKLSTIRTGRANPALVENILVEVFGSKMPIKQLGAISVFDAKKLRIDPWDKTYIEPITQAIQKQSSGLSPVSDSDGVSVNMPDLSEDVRKDMIRTVGQIDDSAKKTIRKYRDEAWSEIQKAQKNGEMSEDEKFKGKEKLQEAVNKINGKVDELVINKKKELES